MNFLKKWFGNAEPETEKASFHPGCKAHATTMASFLTGAKVEVLNPTTNEWEDCDNPVFDPQYDYRIKAGQLLGVVSSAAKTFTVSNGASPKIEPWQPVPDMPDAPVTASSIASPEVGFKRGDVWEARNGFRYLVLADKRSALPDYDSEDNPDYGDIVVMRYNSGKKPAVSTRDDLGHRSDDNPDYQLLRRVGVENITHIGGYLTDTADELCIYDRAGYGKANVRLDRITGEVLLS